MVIMVALVPLFVRLMMAGARPLFEDPSAIGCYNFFHVARSTYYRFYPLPAKQIFRTGAHSSSDDDVHSKVSKPLRQNPRCMAGVGKIRLVEDVSFFIDGKNGVIRRMPKVRANVSLLCGYGYFHDSHLQKFSFFRVSVLVNQITSQKKGRANICPPLRREKRKRRKEINIFSCLGKR
jgi:hypothetical protein